MATFDIYTTTTYIGRQYLARSIVNDISFEIKNYAMGDAGADGSGNAVPPDLSITSCPDDSITGGITPTGMITSFTPKYCVNFELRLDPGMATGTSSNLCIIGTVTASSNPLEIGQNFLYSIGTYDQKTKAAGDAWVINALVSF